MAARMAARSTMHGNAGKILQDHASWFKGDLPGRAGNRGPLQERLNVLSGDLIIIVMTQRAFKKNLDRKVVIFEDPPTPVRANLSNEKMV